MTEPRPSSPTHPPEAAALSAQGAALHETADGAAPPVRRVAVMDETAAEQLGAVLADCVAGNASVSFLAPMDVVRASAFFRDLAPDVAAGRRVVLVAEDARGICGTAQLILDLPENQPHRADVAKVLVHRRARGRGIGAALMRAIEDEARAAGRWLLVLDTVPGTASDRLYRRLGWTPVGEIPDYALNPDGTRVPTMLFYRRLG